MTRGNPTGLDPSLAWWGACIPDTVPQLPKWQ